MKICGTCNKKDVGLVRIYAARTLDSRSAFDAQQPATATFSTARFPPIHQGRTAFMSEFSPGIHPAIMNLQCKAATLFPIQKVA